MEKAVIRRHLAAHKGSPIADGAVADDQRPGGKACRKLLSGACGQRKVRPLGEHLAATGINHGHGVGSRRLTQHGRGRYADQIRGVRGRKPDGCGETNALPGK